MKPGARKVVLRADAGPAIGAGHLMRCLALGRALASRAEVVFVTRRGQPALAEHVRSAGITLVEIEKVYPDRADADAVSGLIGPSRHDWAVVDGYHFDEGYVEQLRACGARTAIIDDEPRLGTYATDVLIDHNLGALRQPYPVASSTRLLLGPRFSLLRPEFAVRAPERPPLRAERLFVSMGGADAANLTRLVLDAISQTRGRFEVTVLVGGANTHADRLMEEFRHIEGLQFVRNATDVAALMAAANLGIVAVGGVMWELAALGIPALVVSATDVQRRVAATADAYGAHRWVGDVASLSATALADAIVSLCNDRAGRLEMARLGPSLVDGRGASRVADALLTEAAGAEWSIRRACPGDAEPLWEIAADPSVRKHAFTTEAFPYARHESWFLERLARPSARVWVITRDGIVGGSVRYDAEGPAALISIAVATAFRGRRLATQLLSATWPQACRELGVERARGVVFEENRPSLAAFERAGFAEVSRQTMAGHACVVFEAGVRQGVVHE